MENCRFEIEPFKGTNSLKLGLTSEEYQLIIWLKPNKFYRTYACKNYTDDYGFCHIEYDDNGKSKSISFFNPTEVSFNGFLLLGGFRNSKEVKEYMLSIDPNCDNDESNIFSSKYNIYLYLHTDEFVECVTVYPEVIS